MKEETTEWDIALELAAFKFECIEAFSCVSKVVSAQIGVTVAITEALNDHGLLPPGQKRTDYFTAVKKSLAELDGLNEFMSKMIESSSRDLSEARKKLAAHTEPPENE